MHGLVVINDTGVLEAAVPRESAHPVNAEVALVSILCEETFDNYNNMNTREFLSDVSQRQGLKSYTPGGALSRYVS